MWYTPTFPSKLVFTKRGVHLKKEEFMHLASRMDELNYIWQGLVTLKPCRQTHTVKGNINHIIII
jgi:hypothetical protein